MPFSIHEIYGRIFKIWRRKRFALFLQSVQPAAADTLLDVGGNPGCWLAERQCVARIDTLNLHPVAWDGTRFPDYHIKTLVGDGCSLALPDRSYDIGFSNSVIEHVGSWARQQQFAAEIRRVANGLWVQTPAYECPIEPHYLTPFIHYLPAALQKKILRWFTVRGWIERPTRDEINFMVDTTRLLKKSEVRQLFPDCEILTERLLGIIPKSYIAFRRKA